MDNKRYKVVDGSQSAHCCFEATVVDTTKPYMIAAEHYNNQFESVCESFCKEDAEKIADALNNAPTLLNTQQVGRFVPPKSAQGGDNE